MNDKHKVQNYQKKKKKYSKHQIHQENIRYTIKIYNKESLQIEI